jgi:hypothetical protein
MRMIAVTVLVLLLPLKAFATAQSPDVLLYDGQVFNLFSNPLESLYLNERERPDFRLDAKGTVSTGNWRGYVALWEVKGDRLYLLGLDSWVGEKKGVLGIFRFLSPPKLQRADLKELFGERCREGRVEASWFSGELKIPDGKILQYAHMGYGSVYERDIVFTVEQGRVTGRMVVDNTKGPVPSRLELEGRELEKMNKEEGRKKK